MKMTDTELARAHRQVWQNEAMINNFEGVCAVIRSAPYDDVGVSYREMFPIALKDDEPVRYLRDRLTQFRHAKDVNNPFFIEVFDGYAKPDALDRYQTMGELRATFKR